MNNDTQTRNDALHESCHCILGITDGLHVGAEIDIEADTLMMLGATANCDVQLLDKGIADYHVAISRKDDTVMARAIDKEIKVDNELIKPGFQIELSSGCEILLTPTVKLYFENDLPVQEIKQEQVKKLPISKAWSIALVLLMMGVIGVVSTSFATISDKQAIITSTLFDNTQEVQSMLEVLSLQDKVVATKLKSNRWELNGIVDNGEEITELRAYAKAHKMDIVFRVSTADQLMSQVSDVFRTNGLSAVLLYKGDGVIEITNLHEKDKGVDRVIHHAKKDIYGLKKLTFSGDAKIVVKPGLKSVGDIDKKLTVIVGSDVSYLATADGTRYFLGSVLPGGYKIEKISGKGVLVALDNESTLLSF